MFRIGVILIAFSVLSQINCNEIKCKIAVIASSTRSETPKQGSTVKDRAIISSQTIDGLAESFNSDNDFKHLFEIPPWNNEHNVTKIQEYCKQLITTGFKKSIEQWLDEDLYPNYKKGQYICDILSPDFYGEIIVQWRVDIKNNDAYEKRSGLIGICNIEDRCEKKYYTSTTLPTIKP